MQKIVGIAGARGTWRVHFARPAAAGRVSPRRRPEARVPDPSSPPSADARAPAAGRPPKWGIVAIAAAFLVLAGLQAAQVLSKKDARGALMGSLTDPATERWLLGSPDPASPRPVGVAF